jgi:fermentation-respiration switch protein FrsA (DUF1100 family)
MRRARGAALFAVLVLPGTVVLTSCKLDAIVFSGDKVGQYSLPATVVPDSLIEPVTFTSGGETLHGYWLRQPGAAVRLAAVFSHGKGGNLSQEVEWRHAEGLWQAGLDVLTYDYRGFGRSSGSSEDETTLTADAQAALGYVRTQRGVPLARIVSYGHSLGSAPAIALAAANPGIRTLIIESGFSTGQAMAETANPLGIPVGWLLREPMLNVVRIGTVTAPVLIMHGALDRLIPVEQGRALYAAARDPKQLEIVPAAGHENLPQVLGLVAYIALVRGFTAADVP